jgi:hypothetical protein
MCLLLLMKRSTILSRRLTIPSLSSTTTQDVRWFSDEGAQPVTKVKKKKKGKQKTTAGHDRALDIIMRALDAPILKESPEPDEEEMARRYEIGRNYVKGMFERHNELNHDLACKMKMKTFAIKMLPRNSKLKEEALKVDASSPPLWRPIMADTPPIPDFDPTKFIHRDDD